MARTLPRSRPMSERADALRQQLIRNFDEVPEASGSFARRSTTPSAPASAPAPPPRPRHQHRHPRAGHARLPLPPASRREEAFVVLEGRGTLRVAGELLEIKAGDVAFLPPGPGLSAPDHQHLGRAAEVPLDQHPGAAGDRRVSRLGQVPGDVRPRRPGASPAWRASPPTSTTGKASLERAGRAARRLGREPLAQPGAAVAPVAQPVVQARLAALPELPASPARRR